MPERALLEALAVTAELVGTTLSKPAAQVFAEDLALFPLDQVLGALTRCRREVRGRLVLADVLERLDDGRPGVEAAWAMLPRGEGASVVWTAEMAQAFGVAAPLLDQGDAVAARMAFKEAYPAAVQAARDRGEPVRWMLSPGFDPAGRERAILEAEERGRIGADRAAALRALHCAAAADGDGRRLAGPSPVSALLPRPGREGAA
ncbi:MAG: hypothetical protein ACU85V_20410 [Gammaproteobacteria bacterium]